MFTEIGFNKFYKSFLEKIMTYVFLDIEKKRPSKWDIQEVLFYLKIEWINPIEVGDFKASIKDILKGISK